MEERGEEGEGGCAWEDEVGPAGPGRGSTVVAVGHRRRRQGGGKGRRREGKRRGRGTAAGDGEGRVREALHGRKNEEHEETLGTTMEVSHQGRRPSPEPRRNPSIARDSGVRSTNRTRPDEVLDETNASVPSDSADDARIGSNCSPELSPELEPLRTSASNTGS
jgi:hypothetical protein